LKQSGSEFTVARDSVASALFLRGFPLGEAVLVPAYRQRIEKLTGRECGVTVGKLFEPTQQIAAT